MRLGESLYTASTGGEFSRTTSSNGEARSPILGSVLQQFPTTVADLNQEYQAKYTDELAEMCEALRARSEVVHESIKCLRARGNILKDELVEQNERHRSIEARFETVTASSRCDVDSLIQDMEDMRMSHSKLHADIDQLRINQDGKISALTDRLNSLEGTTQRSVTCVSDQMRTLQEVSESVQSCQTSIMDNLSKIHTVAKTNSTEISKLQSLETGTVVHVCGSPIRTSIQLENSPTRSQEHRLSDILGRMEAVLQQQTRPEASPLIVRRGGGYEERQLLVSEDNGCSSTSVPCFPLSCHTRQKISQELNAGKFPTVDPSGRVVFTSPQQVVGSPMKTRGWD